MKTLEKSLGSIVAEQAIFTSVRSPTGEGYRIIAASAGLRGDERADITRRCPSHGSLYQEETSVVALLAFPLTSGRFCVAMSYNGGEEHTSRGGCRVYTHAAVMDLATYQQFGCNPVRLHAALRQSVGDTPELNPPSKLPQLCWAIVPSRLDLLGFVPHPPVSILGESRSILEPVSPVDGALHISVSLLRGERLFITGIRDEYELLEKAVITLPMKLRRTLAVSVGLRHSPMRQLQVCFAAEGAQDAQRGLRGQRMRWFDAVHPLPAPPPGYEAWVGLLRRWLSAGRENEVERLTASLTNDVSPAALARIATLANDVDDLDEGGSSKLKQIVTKYERFTPTTELEAELLGRLIARSDSGATPVAPRPMPPVTQRRAAAVVPPEQAYLRRPRR